MKTLKRRQFVKWGLGSLVSFSFLGQWFSKRAEAGAPEVKAGAMLNYQPTTEAYLKLCKGKSKPAKCGEAKGNNCSNCVLWQGTHKDDLKGKLEKKGCVVFPGKVVRSTGMCDSWAEKKKS